MGQIFNEVLHRIRSDTLLVSWNIVSALSVVLPLLFFWSARATSNYEEGGEGGNNSYNSQDYRNEYGYYDNYGNYVAGKKWWQFWKSNNVYREQGGEEGQGDGGNSGDYNNREAGAPWWFFWSRREGEGGEQVEEEGRGCLIFLLIWTIMALMMVSYFVNMTVLRNNLDATRYILIGFANCCFVCCVCISGFPEIVRVEGREIEETGWYGQTSVLVFLVCLFNILSSVGFAIWTWKRQQRSSSSGSSSRNNLKAGNNSWRNSFFIRGGDEEVDGYYRRDGHAGGRLVGVSD